MIIPLTETELALARKRRTITNQQLQAKKRNKARLKSAGGMLFCICWASIFALVLAWGLIK